MQEKIIKKRYSQIDILRGLFFIPMFIFHLFSFYDLTNNFNTNLTSNNFLSFIGNVRDLYILLAGYSIYLSYTSYKESNKNSSIFGKSSLSGLQPSASGFIKYRFVRSGTIAMYALLITVISHFLYPDYGIKFGILHFIALGTLLLAPIAALDSPTITLIVGGIWLYITSNNLIPLARGHSSFGLNLPYSNEIINTITGKFVHYNTADYFPLNTKLILLICGLFLGQVIHPKLKPLAKNDKTIILEEMGKKSLELYTSHFIIIMIVYYILKNKI
jgi:uncharacterized membrane protein